jgi:hypothetical protein
MKKLFILIAGLILSASSAFSQGCLPEGIEFTTQAQIDSFPSNYPGCTRIEGNVTIYGNEITSLDSLYNLKSFGEDLYISFNHKLITLNGLENVTSIEGLLHIENNTSLVSFDGLRNLTSIGGYLYIFFNESLVSLTGFGNLTNIGQGLHIGYCHDLYSLDGLQKVTSLGGGLWIFQNKYLKSLTGLDNIDAKTIRSIYIVDNDSLQECDVKSICDYLSGPDTDVTLHNNATGCNSQDEVEAECAIGIGELESGTTGMEIFPNPASVNVLITTSNKLIDGEIVIYNCNGKAIKSIAVGGRATMIDVSSFPPGLYFVRLSNDKTVEVGKFIKD